MSLDDTARREQALTKFLTSLTKLLDLAYTYLDKRLKEDEAKVQEKARRTS